jgi:K+-sensing histidine kinase KdpD
MSVLLVALTGSERGRAVLDAARRVAPTVDAALVAVHVREDGSEPAVRAAAADADVPVFVRNGAVIDELRAAYAELHAVAIVAGGGAETRVARAIPSSIAVSLDDAGDGTVLLVPEDADARLSRRASPSRVAQSD